MYFLKQHYNVHTGERPYACKYCERKFTNYPNWLKHTRRRHKVDHKTGEELVPKETNKTLKIEAPPTPAPEVPTSSENTEQLLTDFTLSKSDEMLLQQGLLNFPMNDDKFLLQQELLTGKLLKILLVNVITCYIFSRQYQFSGTFSTILSNTVTQSFNNYVTKFTIISTTTFQRFHFSTAHPTASM